MGKKTKPLDYTLLGQSDNLQVRRKNQVIEKEAARNVGLSPYGGKAPIGRSNWLGGWGDLQE